MLVLGLMCSASSGASDSVEEVSKAKTPRPSRRAGRAQKVNAMFFSPKFHAVPHTSCFPVVSPLSFKHLSCQDCRCIPGDGLVDTSHSYKAGTLEIPDLPPSAVGTWNIKLGLYVVTDCNR